MNCSSSRSRWATGYVQDGQVTAEGLEALCWQMPYADLSNLERDRRLDTVTDLFTVDLLVRYITWKLEGGWIGAEGAGAAVLASPRTIDR